MNKEKLPHNQKERFLYKNTQPHMCKQGYQFSDLCRFKIQLPFAEYMLEKGYKASSILQYINDTRLFLIWVNTHNLEVANITYNNILEYIIHIKPGIKQKTIACKMNSLKHYFNFRVANGFIALNPVSGIRIRGIKKGIIYDLLSMNEMEEIYFNFIQNRKKSHVYKNRFSPDELVSRRNKVILGLMIFQGLTTREIADLDMNCISLREGMISVKGNGRNNGRTLKLEAHQIMEISEYISKTRTKIISGMGKKTNRLFMSRGSGNNVIQAMGSVINTLKSLNRKICSFRQIRASVINCWLKIYNLRYVQYMLGHRYVSSTEYYIRNESFVLCEDISRYHPVI